MQVYGKYGEFLAGGRIGIGDYGSTINNGSTVFSGEYDTYDSDVLQLHGKNGFYLTYNSGSLLGYYAVNLNRFYFYSDIYSKGIKLMSDERFKKSISNLNNSLNKIKQINGVSYLFDYESIFNQVNKNSNIESGNPMQDGGKKDTKVSEELYGENDRRLGFLAQNLKETFPELVSVDKNGYHYVDYVGLIPVLVEAIKEQQVIIESQEARIVAIESRLNNEFTNNDVLSKTSVKLYQNSPNPFSMETFIKYSVPENSMNATICVFNLSGNLILTKNISQKGDGTVKIDAGELNPGMYLYSLILEGKVIETKRMILTN